MGFWIYSPPQGINVRPGESQPKKPLVASRHMTQTLDRKGIPFILGMLPSSSGQVSQFGKTCFMILGVWQWNLTGEETSHSKSTSISSWENAQGLLLEDWSGSFPANDCSHVCLLDLLEPHEAYSLVLWSVKFMSVRWWVLLALFHRLNSSGRILKETINPYKSHIRPAKKYHGQQAFNSLQAKFHSKPSFLLKCPC